MRLKPKSTTKNPRALLYKRFIGLEKSVNLNIVYNTTDGLFWTFDNQTLEFTQVESSALGQGTTITRVNQFPESNNIQPTILNYQGTYFRYNIDLGWEKTTNVSDLGLTLLNASFNNVARYQTNKYYFAGSFDFVIKGSIEGTTAQYIKGNIIPLTSLNIKHYEDSIKLYPDDLVVVDGHLYSVENPETVIKQQPKPFKIYFATLNNIL